MPPTPSDYATTVNITVVANVRTQLTRAGRDYTALAKHLDCALGTITSRMSGHTSFSAVELASIAQWLDVDVSTLWANTDQQHEAVGA